MGIPEKSLIGERAQRVYERLNQGTDGEWGMDRNAWDWVPGVGVISQLAYYERNGSPEIIADLRRWVAANRHRAGAVNVINSMAPYAIFPALYRLTGESGLLEEAKRIGDWMRFEAPRTRGGAWEHTVTEDASFPEQVWADTVFMAALFMSRLARVTGQEEYAEEAVRQLTLHLRQLQDEATGVLFHGWDCRAGNPLSGARWTRANAWIALATPMMLEELKPFGTIPDEVPERYRTLMTALGRYQLEGGLWPTVLDRPDFYTETSGSAGIACGILYGIRQGLLEPKLQAVADRALPAVLERIGSDGTVTGVSGGTPVLQTVEHYNEVPCYPTLYGQGLALMLLAEYNGAKGVSGDGE
ncbi:glycoside hydrolase family 88/105 protein [Cohnella fermenti]|uniref:Glycosyl hydrolase n=1 Tax=Cohnella fermenti TaxID=2565925 RepID=A0A4S4BVX6_9BACL|nr:glycoside hydrolase family 88 protein [Cohnella fermenti]THF78768.1 glycosyl hydrolase [Cohnella fermenti]